MQSNFIAKLFSVFAADVNASVAPQKTAPVELDAASLEQVVGGGGPHGGWAAAVVVDVDGPHGGW
jgi:hypothetical protein